MWGQVDIKNKNSTEGVHMMSYSYIWLETGVFWQNCYGIIMGLKSWNKVILKKWCKVMWARTLKVP